MQLLVFFLPALSRFSLLANHNSRLHLSSLSHKTTPCKQQVDLPTSLLFCSWSSFQLSLPLPLPEASRSSLHFPAHKLPFPFQPSAIPRQPQQQPQTNSPPHLHLPLIPLSVAAKTYQPSLFISLSFLNFSINQTPYVSLQPTDLPSLSRLTLPHRTLNLQQQPKHSGARGPRSVRSHPPYFPHRSPPQLQRPWTTAARSSTEGKEKT